MARSPMHRCIPGAPVLALVVAGGMGAVPAAAQRASLTLSSDQALWSDTVTVHVAAVGCTGPASLGSTSTVGQPIDVDILGCSAGSTATYSKDFELGPSYPDAY